MVVKKVVELVAPKAEKMAEKGNIEGLRVGSLLG